MKKVSEMLNIENDVADFSLLNVIKDAKSVLIVVHINPDGDCLGSGLALKYVVEKLGKVADLVCDSPVSSAYAFLDGFNSVNVCKMTEYDVIFALDCGDEFRLGQYLSVFKAARVSVNIDHHFSNNCFGSINVVDKHSASTCSILSEILINDGLMDARAADLLFVGLSTDTGHFFHNNTSKEVFELAAKLVGYGANNFNVVKNLYKSNTLEKTRLISRAINNLRVFDGGRIAIIILSSGDLSACGCTLSDTEGLIDYAINLKTALVAACITQAAKGYKVSFRSKDISILPAAEVFGGGGHVHAAGCVVFGGREGVVDKVKDALSKALEIGLKHNI